jgi:hypothetical protein
MDQKMDLSEAKRILWRIADDDAFNGRAWAGQEESAEIVLNELERLEKEVERYESMLKKPGITIEVKGGMVQNVYTTMGIDIEVDILDFDDNGSRTEDEHDDLVEHLRDVIANQKQIY